MTQIEQRIDVNYLTGNKIEVASTTTNSVGLYSADDAEVIGKFPDFDTARSEIKKHHNYLKAITHAHDLLSTGAAVLTGVTAFNLHQHAGKIEGNVDTVKFMACAAIVIANYFLANASENNYLKLSNAWSVIENLHERTELPVRQEVKL